MKNNSKIAGFTLVESMIAMSIGLVVAGSAIWFLVQGTRISLRTAAASTNDLSEWGILTSMTVDTKVANGMAMFSDFNKATLSDINNRLDDTQPSKLYGNVLILTQSTQGTNQLLAAYQQINGYVFDPTYKTFKKFIYNVKAAEQTSFASLETILKNNFDTLVLLPVATSVSGGCPANPAAGASKTAFVCRKKGQSGALYIQISTGNANVRTDSTKIIETAFYIRG